MIYTHHTPYPTAAERIAIAEYTHMSERQIEVWVSDSMFVNNPQLT